IRAGIKTIILPKDNQKDVSEIKQEYLQGVDIRYVAEMDQLLKQVLEKLPYPKALTLVPPKKEPETTNAAQVQLDEIRQIVAKA
ncbi:MAG: hypothetical protein EAZ89_01880, partial [Bacteroidetes bacterium]